MQFTDVLALIAKGSPLIRIMVKSMAGIAWVTWPCFSVYVSRNIILKHSNHLLEENWDSLAVERTCVDKGESTTTGDQGETRVALLWKKTTLLDFSQKFSIHQASQRQRRFSKVMTSTDPSTRPPYWCHITLALLSVSPACLDPSISAQQWLELQDGVTAAHLLTVLQVG